MSLILSNFNISYSYKFTVFHKPFNIIRKTELVAPQVALSNSSGFGGANVSLLFKRV